uniref:Ig-like domain-containing protein n=1 Tax=Monopterus albus TaxID=43700 RepID=A0A3Q3JEQ5_MONAL
MSYILFLFGFITLSVAKEDTCDLYAAVGESLTLPFVNEGLAKTHVLKWTHNNTLIFHRQQEKVLTGKKEDTSANGSLLLKNLQFSGAGTYEAAVQHSAGSSTKTWTGRLCIMSKVSKPQVTYECDFKSSAVNLTCNVAKPQGLMFSWTHGEKTLTSEKRQTLSISLAQLKGERRFACTVENKVSKERSDTVHPTCKDLSPSPPIVLCFTSKTVVAVLAGGAGLTLLLLIIIIILCCCLRRGLSESNRHY